VTRVDHGGKKKDFEEVREEETAVVSSVVEAKWWSW